jgi:hypothetical protein
MSIALQEFLDDNLHRVYPLTDDSGGTDITDSFVLPTSFISDIFLCAPNLPQIDITKFYISNITIRRFFVDITIGYDDPAVDQPIGSFKNIDTTAPVHSTYQFIPAEIQSEDSFAPLYFMTGQIIIGESNELVTLLGSWNFDLSDAEHSTFIVPTRVSQGLVNVQYISINDRLFTGNVRFREGSNINMDVEQETVDGQLQTVITLSASLSAGSTLSLTSDADVLNELIRQFGVPLLTINGMLPDPNRNFNLFGADCTTVDGLTNGLVISNPCASPCCDEDSNINNILESISNLNSRYGQLKGFYDAATAAINNVQNKLLVLGSEV